MMKIIFMGTPDFSATVLKGLLDSGQYEVLACYVPAESCRLGPVDAIHTRIGAADDLANAQSTFMLEMTEAAQILRSATPQSLVLMDEIGRGTSTYDGLSLATAIAAWLHDKAQCLTESISHSGSMKAFLGFAQIASAIKVNILNKNPTFPKPK